MKVFGFFPSSFVGLSRHGRSKVKPINVLICSCSLFLFVFFAFKVTNRPLKVFNESSLLIKAWDILTKLETLCHIPLVCYQILNRKNILKFLKTIETVDEEVKVKVCEKMLIANFLFIFRQKLLTSMSISNCTNGLLLVQFSLLLLFLF
jgi:hypothetical protein